MKGKTFIVAELSANHNNDFDIAVKTIEAMAKAGADAVKFQTFRPDSFTLDVDNDDFGPKKTGLWKGYRPIDLYTQGAMPYEWQEKLFKFAERLNMLCFSTPFDKEGVDFLESIGCPMYKIASMEINETNLIRYAASKGKPMIMSTGAAALEDLQLAIDLCREVGNDDITLLKCTSEYPAPVEMANLMTIPDMRNRFQVKVGVSDHSMTNIIPVTAVALGASVVEKHFILDRELGGVDSAFSLNPNEFNQMVKDIRETEKALGKADYTLTEDNRKRRRSLYVAEDIKAGDVITEKNVRSVRPGYGLHPKYLPDLIGKIAARDLKKGERFELDMLVSL